MFKDKNKIEDFALYIRISIISKYFLGIDGEMTFIYYDGYYFLKTHAKHENHNRIFN